MKVNSQRDITFKSIYNNNAIKRSLEFASDNGMLFKASATIAFSVARPLAIWCTPQTEKENRKLASAKSITSNTIEFLMMLGISTPLAKSIKKIDKNPQKFLKKETINKYKEPLKTLADSKAYIFATQLFKLGLGTIVAFPKAILVALGIPYTMKLFEKNINDKEKDISADIDRSRYNNYKSKNKPSFQAKPVKKLAKGISSILDKKWYQEFTNKYKNTNFPMHIMALTDIISTGMFIQQTNKSKKIENKRKTTLIYNSAISTGLCITGGYAIDKLLEKPTKKFIDKYKKINKGQANLEKQVQGIKIVKPIFILGTIYYIIIPFISTFLAERFGKKNNSNKQNNFI